MSPPEHIGSNTKHHYLHEFSSEIRIIVLSTEEHNATAGLHAATVPWRWLHCMPQHCKKKTSSQAQALRQSNSSHSSGQSLVVACKPILCLLEGVHHWCGHLVAIRLEGLGVLGVSPFLLDAGTHSICRQFEILDLRHSLLVHAFLREQVLSNWTPRCCMHGGPLDLGRTFIDALDKRGEGLMRDHFNTTKEAILNLSTIFNVHTSPTHRLGGEHLLKTPRYKDSINVEFEHPVVVFPGSDLIDLLPHLFEHPCVHPSLSLLPLDNMELVQIISHFDGLVISPHSDINIREHIKTRARKHSNTLAVLLLQQLQLLLWSWVLAWVSIVLRVHCEAVEPRVGHLLDIHQLQDLVWHCTPC